MPQRNIFNSISFGKEVSITNRADSKALTSYINELSKMGSCLTAEKEAELFETYRKTNDERIINYIIEKNLRFVISVAKPYAAAAKVPLEDVIEEGNIGLMKAAHLFDPTLGFRFMSFAVYHVRKSILESLEKTGNLIHVPVWKQTMRAAIKKMAAEFEQKEFRAPTTEEIADALNVSTSEIASCFGSKDILSLSSAVVSGKDDDNLSLGDTLTNDTFSNPDESTDNILAIQAIKELFKSITWKEEYILRRLYAIGTSEATEDEVADELHMTKERVRQLKMLAINKIKNNPSAAELAHYFATKG